MKEHTKPIYVGEEREFTLTRLDYSARDFDELWLQSVIQRNPSAIPIQEIEPVFSDAIPLCTEMETESGFCDNVFVNDRGFISIIECKLWRNPEARRTVVAQILDYAKDIAKWQYEEFESAVLKARKERSRSLIEVMRQFFPDVDETAFVDGINANLRQARLLLLIMGDGIRENAEDLLRFLNVHSHMRFVLSFVEMPVYRVENTNDYLITPRVIAKTTELIRTVVVTHETEADRMEEVDRNTSQTTSEKVFFERLATNIGNIEAKELQDFVRELSHSVGIHARTGRGKTLSLNIKSGDDRYNFGSVQEDGRVYFYGIVPKTAEIGNRQIGVEYLSNLARLVGGTFQDRFNEWSWCVQIDDTYPTIGRFLDKKKEWQDLIETTLEEIKKTENE